jgi:preprotein translocase subunit SecE
MAKDKASTAPEKSDKKGTKKPGKVAKWFKDLKSEFKKVVWPSKKTVVNNTSVVLAVVVFSAIIIGLLDSGFLALMNLVYNH